MDGFEATKKIRTFNKNIPVVALSAAVMPKDKELTFEAGMNGHLSKPIHKGELESFIKERFETTVIEKARALNSDNEHLFSKITHFDVNELYQTLGLPLEKVLTIYETYKNFLRESMGQLDEITASPEKLAAYIHKLKGTSANTRVESVRALCEEIEVQGVSAARITALKTELQQVYDEIETYITPLLHQNRIKTETIDDAKRLLDTILYNLTESYLVSQADLTHLLSALKGFIKEDEKVQLQDAFDQGDDESMLVMLEKIKGKLHES